MYLERKGSETSEDIPLSPTVSQVLISRLPRRLDAVTLLDDEKQKVEDKPQAQHAAPKDAIFTVVVLTTINLCNYIDRYVPSAAKGPIQLDLDLDDAQTSLPLTGFIIVYMLSAPVFGFLADSGNISRLKLIAFGIIFWSITTMLTGLANNFASYFIIRSLVGFGESGYATIVPGIVSDLFPPDKRNFYLTVFQAAAPIGAALGFILGGYLSGSVGWRWMFVFSGIPGLLLTTLLLCIDDPPRGRFDTHPLNEGYDMNFESPKSSDREASRLDIKNKVLAITASLPSLKETIVVLARNKVYVYCVIGQVLVTWAIGGLADWLPEYFRRQYGVTPAQAGLFAGGATVLGGLFGTMTGGYLGDKLIGRTHLPYMAISAIGLIPSTIFIFLALTVAQSIVTSAITASLSQLFLWWYNGPITALITNSVAPNMRARAFSISILLLHLLGDATSPYIIGSVSDWTGNLQTALLMAPVATGLAAITWIVGWATLSDPNPTDNSITATEGEGGESFEILESRGGGRFYEMSERSKRDTSSDDEASQHRADISDYNDDSGDESVRVAFTTDPTNSKTGLSSYDAEEGTSFSG